MASLTTIDQMFQHEIGDIYDAEHRFLEAQREMLGHASDDTLRAMIEEHIGQSEQQIGRLEQVYGLLGVKPKRVKCDAAAGLVTEGQKLLKHAAERAELLDCAIAGAQAKVEHYEIASYRGLLAQASVLEQVEIGKLLRANLSQEVKTAERLEKSQPGLLQKVWKEGEPSA